MGVFTELRRRSVFKVAGVYAIVAWLVVQVAETTFPYVGLPDWSITLVIALTLAGLPLALVLAWAFDITDEGVVRTPRSARARRRGASEDRSAAPERDHPIRAVAVLPFVDLSAEGDQEYFGDGITEELLNVLAKIEGLRVPARTSSFAFKGQQSDIREIGEKLGVEAVIEGSVRRSGDHVRVTAQLIDVRDGYHLWSDRFDRELRDILAMQDEIARAILHALRIRIRFPAELALPHLRDTTNDGEAYQLYLKGLFFWNKGSEEALRRAGRLYNSALEQDPLFARAHAGLADTLAALGAHTYLDPHKAYPQAKAAASRALELAPELAEAHAALGRIALLYDWDLPTAERELRRALELNPGSSVSRQHYARCLLILGRIEEAVAEARRAVDLDPLSVSANTFLGVCYRTARRYGAATEQLEASLALDPDAFLPHYHLAFTHAFAGEHDAAILAAERASELAGRNMFALGALGYAYGRAGDRQTAEQVVGEMEARAKETYVCPFDIAVIYAGLGEAAPALGWLERGYQQRDHAMLLLNADPALDPVRREPGFADLVRRVGLPGAA